MKQVRIDFGKTVRGFMCEIDDCGDLIVNFGNLSLNDLINAIGRDAVLEEFAEDEVIQHFKIDISET